MSYYRVLPRDAFNESSLLKCIGKLTLLIEDGMAPGWQFYFDGSTFDIQQDTGDGSLFAANVRFRFNDSPVTVFRPLNARDAWPLFVELDGDPVQVFTEAGELEIKATT